MSATTSLVQVLKDQGFAGGRVFDLRVPESIGPNVDYIWLGRSGSDSDDCLTDEREWRQFVDIEFWGPEGFDGQQGGDDVRAFLQNYPAGAFGAGTVGGLRVTDQRDEYELRNAAADDYCVNGLLSVEIHNYQEP